MAGVFAITLFDAHEADAYCRSTTCRGSQCETDDDGCPISGKPLYWSSSCIGFNLQRNGSERVPLAEARLAILNSFAAWSEVPCPGGGNASLSFSPGEDVACHQSGYNTGGTNVNVVMFQDNDWKYRGIDGTLAKTSVTFNEETGEIYDADIEVNTAFNEVTVSDDKIVYDLQAIMTHEVGHYLGFAHSPKPSATMYASYTPGTIGLRSLSDDDLGIMCEVYPPDRKAVCDTTPRGGMAAPGTCGEVTKTPTDPNGCAVAVERANGGPWQSLSASLVGAVFGLSVLRRRARRSWRR